MSHFYASIRGNRGLATRQGTKESGIWGHIRGWDIGASVDCWVDNEGNDCLSIYITGGSNQLSPKKALGCWAIINGEIEKKY